MKELQINWFDIVAAALLVFGMFRGKKRGMSAELLSVFQMLLVLVLGSLYYEPLGNKLAQKTGMFSLLSCYLAVYITIAILVRFIFANLKRLVGDKLVGSDVFGRGEYYLGMVSGVVRYATGILIFLALLNSRAISSETIARQSKSQSESFGMSFPTFSTIQTDILKVSRTGKYVKENFNALLIKATVPENKGIPRREENARKRERAVEESIGTPPPKK